MNILIVNTNDVGGAGKACTRLHVGLLNSGIESKLLLKNKVKDNIESYVFKQTKKVTLSNRIKNKFTKILRELKILKPPKKPHEEIFLQSRKKGLELFSFPNSDYDITESDLYTQADIINLHWVSGFIDYQSFFKKNKKPVVWTLHDMNPFSGGEHYKETYFGIDENGFPIKRDITLKEIEYFKKVLDIKKKSLTNVKNLHFVTLCSWMTNEIKKNEFFSQFPIHSIPNSIDSNIFKIRDKTYSRNLLNIPLEKKVVLFVADLINTNRKGFEFLIKAIEKLKDSNVLLFVVGHKNKRLEAFSNIVQYGIIHDDRLLSIVYSAADVFVIPSIMDNLPNTVLESLFCGTPVIGFSIGGIPDMIQDKKNGLLADKVSVNSLTETIHYFLEKGVSLLSEEIRKEAINKYDEKVQANNYIKLFKSLLN